MDQDILKRWRERFDTFGLLRVRNVFSREEQDRILDDIAAVTGLGDDDYPDVAAGRSKAYCSPGTIARNKALWPIIYHENILTLMRVLIDENVNFMGDNLSVHWHNVGFHRDQEFDLANPPAWAHDGITAQDGVKIVGEALLDYLTFDVDWYTGGYQTLESARERWVKRRKDCDPRMSVKRLKEEFDRLSKQGDPSHDQDALAELPTIARLVEGTTQAFQEGSTAI